MTSLITTFRISQELKAFKKTDTKTYMVLSNTRLGSPWMRTIDLPFNLNSLNLSLGQPIHVSLTHGVYSVYRDTNFYSQDANPYALYRSTNDTDTLIKICESGLIEEFDQIPNFIFYTPEPSNVRSIKSDCGC